MHKGIEVTIESIMWAHALTTYLGFICDCVRVMKFHSSTSVLDRYMYLYSPEDTTFPLPSNQNLRHILTHVT